LSFAAASCLENRAQLSPSGRNAIAASPNHPVRAGNPIDLEFLYLAMSMAANTKYSINSFFFPDQKVTQAHRKPGAESTLAADGSSASHMRMETRFREEDRPRNNTVQSPPQLGFH
jgi:hypothetical protein